ncbi:MAG: hypothetical protein BIFFINMI_02561 [Phycisphaerae bacterium]|nr:hypothetical protein [Phycisphaerae bacterium]
MCRLGQIQLSGIMSLLIFSGGCAPDLARLPRTLAITAGPVESVDVGPGRVWEHVVLADATGPMWVIASTRPEGTAAGPLRLIARRRSAAAAGWGPHEELASVEHPPAGTVLNFDAILDDAGQPTVAWAAAASAGLPAPLHWMRWDGRRWAGGTIPGAATGGPTALARDGGGRIHCVFTGRLQPEEDYIRGIDGFFPRKVFHASFDGVAWSPAKPIMGPSRWDYDQVSLLTDAGGAVHLLGRAHYGGLFSYGPRAIELRDLTPAGWSGPHRLTDDMDDLVSYAAACDLAGALHMVYASAWLIVPRDVRYRRRAPGGGWSAPTTLAHGDLTSVCAAACDTGGRVWLSWARAESSLLAPPTVSVQVLDRSAASDTTPLTDAGDWNFAFARSPSPAAWATWSLGERVYWQRLTVQPKPSTAAGSPSTQPDSGGQ